MDSLIAICLYFILYAFSRICLCDTVILIVQADIIITIIVMVIIIYTKSFLIKYLFITDYQVKRRLTL